MKESSAMSDVSFEKYDDERFALVLAVAPVILAEALRAPHKADLRPEHVRHEIATEALALADTVMSVMYGERLAERQDNGVDLRAEARGE